MKHMLLISAALIGLCSTSAQAESRRKCDVDSERLSGNFFLIAPDGRFCEASEAEARAYYTAMNDEQARMEAQEEAEYRAQLARYKADYKRAMIQGGASPKEAQAAAEAAALAMGGQTATAGAQAEQAARGAERAARNAQRMASAAAPSGGPSRAGCMGGDPGGICIPKPNVGAAGKAIGQSMRP